MSFFLKKANNKGLKNINVHNTQHFQEGKREFRNVLESRWKHFLNKRIDGLKYHHYKEFRLFTKIITVTKINNKIRPYL